ncbi:hypothetical protein AWRI1499_3379 [Brettanomyces bruxellensis AWRI1499]|nr:hypothetical protein AWRI1499_3379 [Brettanomyces bruxellensis AWRI1499]
MVSLSTIYFCSRNNALRLPLLSESMIESGKISLMQCSRHALILGGQLAGVSFVKNSSVENFFSILCIFSIEHSNCIWNLIYIQNFSLHLDGEDIFLFLFSNVRNVNKVHSVHFS